MAFFHKIPILLIAPKDRKIGNMKIMIFITSNFRFSFSGCMYVFLFVCECTCMHMDVEDREQCRVSFSASLVFIQSMKFYFPNKNDVMVVTNALDTNKSLCVLP